MPHVVFIWSTCNFFLAWHVFALLSLLSLSIVMLMTRVKRRLSCKDAILYVLYFIEMKLSIYTLYLCTLSAYHSFIDIIATLFFFFIALNLFLNISCLIFKSHFLKINIYIMPCLEIKKVLMICLQIQKIT